MIRRAVLDAIGLLDDRFFLYYEEVDFCRRARRAGWSCWYVPESRVVHLVGQSTRATSPTQRNRRPAYWFESRRRYFLKHHPLWYAVVADAAFALGLALCQLRWRIQRRPDRDPPGFLRDFARHSLCVRGWRL
jgi:GT2 family glycosyltransferase